MENRVKNIFNKSEKKPDTIIIKNSSEPFIDENFFYVTGLEKGLFEGSVAILYPSGNIDLIVSELEAETAKKSNANIKVYTNESELYGYIKDSISSSKNIGLNYQGISLKEYCKLINKFPESDFIDISDSIAKTRLIKDNIEIELIKKSCNIIDKVMEKIPEILHEGMYEYELAAEIDYLIQRYGADKSAFETISSFGKNTSQPHYSHGNTKLKIDDFVLCDIGACFKKYNSDITRTFIFGKASNEQKALYQTVKEAQIIGFNIIKTGVKTNEVHNAVNSFIDRTKFKGRFIHSTGHSLGLSVHDRGARLSSVCEVELKENMVFTIEPGIYIPNFGGVRIEDDILIKKDGMELLTKTSREIIEI